MKLYDCRYVTSGTWSYAYARTKKELQYNNECKIGGMCKYDDKPCIVNVYKVTKEKTI